MGAASFDALGADRDLGSVAYRPEDFPGCESFHLPASEIDRYEGRLEFWDGVTETAWKVCEPTSIQHEEPSRLLVQMSGQFAMLRGSRIACFGSADLVRRDAAGGKRWLMQADEVLYLHPDRVRLRGPAIEVDTDPLPEVVLEVDHTTDVRRRKLGIYKESGFAEIWCTRGHDAAARSAHGIGERKGAGKEPRPRSPGRPCGRPHGRCGRCPRIPGDRDDPGNDAVPGAVQRNSGSGRGGGGAGVYRRSRLPAANSGAARPARRASAPRRSGVTCAMRVTEVLLGDLQSAADQVEFLFRRGDRGGA